MTNIPLKLLLFVEKHTRSYDKSHDLGHAIRVLHNAFIIIDNERPILYDKTVDHLKIVTYACMTHDIIDHKYPDADKKEQLLDDFLANELNTTEVSYVKEIIKNMSYSKEIKYGYPSFSNSDVKNLRNIVSDADKIDALGESGYQRCLEYTIASNPKLNKYEINELVIKHCHDKLLHLKDEFIRTDFGKKLAQLGHDYIVDFVAQYK